MTILTMFSPESFAEVSRECPLLMMSGDPLLCHKFYHPGFTGSQFSLAELFLVFPPGDSDILYSLPPRVRCEIYLRRAFFFAIAFGRQLRRYRRKQDGHCSIEGRQGQQGRLFLTPTYIGRPDTGPPRTVAAAGLIDIMLLLTATYKTEHGAGSLAPCSP